MRQKKIFKRRQERHPVKWTLITTGLLALSFASFSAGVQFAEITRETPKSLYADTEPQHGVQSGVSVPLKVAHSAGRDI